MESEFDIQQAKAAIVEAARQLLAGRLGVIEASREISRHRHTVDPDMNDQELLGFLAVDSESDGLAVGTVIDEWHSSLRDEKIKEVRDFEDLYRARSLHDAQVLMKRYGPSS